MFAILDLLFQLTLSINSFSRNEKERNIYTTKDNITYIYNASKTERKLAQEISYPL